MSEQDPMAIWKNLDRIGREEGGQWNPGDGPVVQTKDAEIERLQQIVVKLARALDALLPAAHRARSLCSSGDTFNFCNDWDEQDAAEYAEAIEQADRTLAEVAGEPEARK